MKNKVLIFGAGAIGRGFLANILIYSGFSIDFIDKDPELIQSLKKRTKYITSFISSTKYRFNEIKYDNSFFLDDKVDISEYEAVFLCVGPTHCLEIFEKLNKAKIIFVLENDREIKNKLKKSTNNKNVFFGIPDVITSNTSPKELLLKDLLCLVSETGKLIFETNNCTRHFFKHNKHIQLVKKREFNYFWNCKFYLHNAPHAIVAYLGDMKKYTYIHQAMADKIIKNTIEQLMENIQLSLIKLKLVPENMAISYMKNELKRFKNDLLFDPISRVAREPLRKLEKNGRIIKTLDIINKAGYDSNIVIKGISAALVYFFKNNEGQLYDNPKNVLQKVCEITDNAIINKILNDSAFVAP